MQTRAGPIVRAAGVGCIAAVVAAAAVVVAFALSLPVTVFAVLFVVTLVVSGIAGTVLWWHREQNTDRSLRRVTVDEGWWRLEGRQHGRDVVMELGAHETSLLQVKGRWLLVHRPHRPVRFAIPLHGPARRALVACLDGRLDQSVSSSRQGLVAERIGDGLRLHVEPVFAPMPGPMIVLLTLCAVPIVWLLILAGVMLALPEASLAIALWPALGVAAVGAAAWMVRAMRRVWRVQLAIEGPTLEIVEQMGWGRRVHSVRLANVRSYQVEEHAVVLQTADEAIRIRLPDRSASTHSAVASFLSGAKEPDRASAPDAHGTAPDTPWRPPTEELGSRFPNKRK